MTTPKTRPLTSVELQAKAIELTENAAVTMPHDKALRIRAGAQVYATLALAAAIREAFERISEELG